MTDFKDEDKKPVSQSKKEVDQFLNNTGTYIVENMNMILLIIFIIGILKVLFSS